MQDRLGPIFSWTGNDATAIHEMTWQDIASPENPGVQVSSFRELMNKVAVLSFYNQHLNLFYRGQNKDYYNRLKCLDAGSRGTKSVLSLLPQAFRDTPPFPGWDWTTYVADGLPILEEELKRELKRIRNKSKYTGDDRQPFRVRITDIVNFRETAWANLQHYGIPTPLLDVTQSLHVAATFATCQYPNLGDLADGGVIYVFGLPATQGMITFDGANGIVLVKLQAACPHFARRPHCQQGYLVGSVPHTADCDRRWYRNLALRLVCKFRVPCACGFWGERSEIQPLAAKLLTPKRDTMKKLIKAVEKGFKNRCSCGNRKGQRRS